MEGLVFEGSVIEGDRLGRTIGFPTANIETDSQTAIPAGVFACRAALDNGMLYPGMMNVGYRPTVNLGKERRVEVHLFDFNGNLYGQKLRIEIVKFIRGEHRFNSLDALKEQLLQDSLSIRKLFGL